MRGIQAESFRASDISEVDFERYDVVVLTSSWDERCTALIDSGIDKVPVCVLMLFDEKDDLGVRDANDASLINYAKEISDKQYVIKGGSTEVDHIWRQFHNAIIDTVNELKKPLSILYDLSCCPCYYSLTALSTLFKYGLAGKIDYFYNECTYPEKTDDLSLEEVSFTAGKWEAKTVEHLTGTINPGAKNRFTVSVGFEGSKTLMALNEFEPDKVNVIIPCPGYTEEYVNRVRSANDELFKSFGVLEDSEILSHAGDPIEVWLKTSQNIKRHDNWNDYFLCAGSKPHSLGLAIAAISMATPSLIYSQPKKHNPVSVMLKPDCWLYKVKNIVVPLISNDD